MLGRIFELIRHLFVVAAIFLFSPAVFSQTVSNENNTGFPENGIVKGTDIESVQVTNGNVHIEIPIYKSPGRGLDVAYRFLLDSKGWGFATVCGGGVCTDHPNIASNANPILTVKGPFTYVTSYKGSALYCGDGMIQYIYDKKSNVVLTEPNGTKHHFVPDPIKSSASTSICDPDSSTYASTLYANDGSGYVATVNPTTLQILSVTSKDGLNVLGSITDRNGNRLSPSGFIGAGTDTLNKTASADGSYVDPNGTTRGVTIVNTTVPLNLGPLCSFSNEDACTALRTSLTAPSSVTLPNNMVYSFTYDQNHGGEPLTMTLPTGGQVTWTWGLWDTSGRRVASRTVTANGVTGTWNYTYVGLSGSPLTSATTTDPANNDTRYTCNPVSIYTVGNWPCYVAKTEYFNGLVAGNQIIKTVTTDFQTYPFPNNHQFLVPIRETTKWNGTNQVRKTETDVDTIIATGGTATWQNPVEMREFDWGVGAPGPLVRRTHYTYKHLQDSTYRAKNISDKPTSEIIYDGASTIFAQTNYTYDNPASIVSTSATPATGHDYTNYSSTNTVRGNLTKISHWLNTTGTWLDTNQTFDDLGNLLSTTDPLGHTTSSSYADNFTDGINRNTFAYVTQTNYPTTSGIAHTARAQYYWNLGLVAAKCGQNFPSNQPCSNQASNPQPDYTKSTYDLMGRIVSVSSGEGGQGTNTYNDVALPLSIASSEKITAAVSKTNMTYLDGLGRVKQTQFTSDPDGTDSVDLTYDKLGRIFTISNPHRTAGLASDGVTTYFYDPLGRACLIVPADGVLPSGTSCPTVKPANTIFTTYSGNSSTSSDPAGNSRKSVSDGLGRLTQIFEDPTGLNYETDYTFDPLDNLRTINQKGGSPNSTDWRARTFNYDSLARLLSVSNPESGTVVNTYDNDGNLATITSPKPNQVGSATVVTTNTYDALDRLLQKSFNDGVTPSIKYGYDGVTITCTPAPPSLAITNPISKRTAMCDRAGAESWSYDLMGRMAVDSRTTNLITKTTTYAHDFDGNITSITYPSGSVIAYDYSPASRATAATDNARGLHFALNATYAPHGQLSSVQNATNATAPISRWFYNNRLQPCRMSVKSAVIGPLNCTDVNAGDILDLSYDFGIGVNNNGNVINITNKRDPARSQMFAYDALNRSKTAKTTSTTGTKCWDESYGYDAWGNLKSIARIAGYTCSNEELLNVSAGTNNRIDSFSYDAAGSLAGGDGIGSPYSYDAENQLILAGATTYTYDGDGNRVQKSGGYSYWYGGGSTVLNETDLAGSVSNTPFREYIYFNDNRIGVRNSGNNVYYTFDDHLGTARVVTNSTGTIVDDSDFYPFGGERQYLYTSGNKYKFSNNQRDFESSFDNSGFRYFSPLSGRFNKPDLPFAGWEFQDPQSLNLYSYVNDNPLNMVDPTGHNANPSGSCFSIPCIISWLLGRDIDEGEAGSKDAGSLHWGTYATNPDTAFNNHMADVPIRGIHMTLGQFVRGSDDMMEEAAEFLLSFQEAIDPTGMYATVIGNQLHMRSKADVGLGFAGVFSKELFPVVKRSSAVKMKFLKLLAEDYKTPSWMKQWLRLGLNPPGYDVDHIIPLSVWGKDVVENMRLVLRKDHWVHHKFYHPWTKLK